MPTTFFTMQQHSKTMAFSNVVLFLLILLPCGSKVQSQETSAYPKDQNHQGFETMMTQACQHVDDQTSCLANLQSRLDTWSQQNPISVLKAALENTLNEARLAADSLTKFSTLSVSYREQIAIDDCKELLDFSVSELAWSLAEMNRIRSGVKNSHYEGNLKAWLSAALSNQDTCLEGFEGTDRRLERFVRGSLTQVTQLISNVLSLYTRLHSLPFKPPRNSPNDTSESVDFPEWMTEGDQEIVSASPKGMHVDSVVALDGSGHYRSIAQAVYEAPSYSIRRYIIYVKRGVYHENVDMRKQKTNIMLVGDGIGQTVITGNRNFMQGWTTFRTATVAVSGKGFIARDISFRNTAGPENHQGVALRVDSDQSAFFRCSMEGHQDTLYIQSLRQFYRECSIYGTIDFIFGNGSAVLQNCKLFTGNPLPLQKVTITAQGRKSPDQSTGFIIQDSFVYATRPTYLGRPWKQFSRTVFMNTYMSSMVEPRGWLEWSGNFALGTLWFGEYRNYGPGASLAGRVKWPGYHIIMDASAAGYFTVGRFIDGRSWLPSTGIKFTDGLTN
ncbi:putative pectinesterase/pectinesterase inhibitor 22 [Coffea arabica]|uniref:Pectinesterase n=1 Tax=Coffea arabica TaxID=13443 RepID=A0A6P6WHQ5_COFAR